MNFKLTANTHVGEVRDHNEDNFFVCSDLATDDWSFDKSIEYELGELGSVLIVADGMGGMNAGEVASAIAVESSKSYFTDNKGSINIESEGAIKEFLKNTIVHAHQEILQHQNTHPETAGMGTTLILGWVINGVAYIGWCGDSRAYLYNPNLASSGRAKQFEDFGLRVKGNLALISKDHSYVQTLVDKGDLNHSQAFFHPESNIITQSLGQSGQDISPSTTSLTLFEGDMLILCSDGINAMLEDGEIETVCSEHATAAEISGQLISNANAKGGHDNSTVTIYHTLSASHAIDDPLASAIKRDLNKRKASKSNYLKLIVLVLLIGSTIGALYFSFKDKFSSVISSHNTTEEFLVLESDLILKDMTLNVGDTLFYEKKSGRLKVEIRIDELRNVTSLDTTDFKDVPAKYFYVTDKSSLEDSKKTPEETEVDETADPAVKDVPSKIESEQPKPSESKKSEFSSTGKWRVKLSTLGTRKEKSDAYNDLNPNRISIQKSGNKWIYYYGCFNSKEEAKDWIKAHPEYNKPELVDNISCDVKDDEPLKSAETEDINKGQTEETVESSSKLTRVKDDQSSVPGKDVAKQMESNQEPKPTEKVVKTPKEEEQEESPQPDSTVEKSDTSKIEDNKNI